MRAVQARLRGTLVEIILAQQAGEPRHANEAEKAQEEQMDNLNDSYSLMQNVYSGNRDAVNELTGATEDLTDEQEDNTDAVEEQAETYEMSAL